MNNITSMAKSFLSKCIAIFQYLVFLCITCISSIYARDLRNSFILNDEGLEVIERVNSLKPTDQLTSQDLYEKKINVHESGFSESNAFFLNSRLKQGDQILYNLDEAEEFTVTTSLESVSIVKKEILIPYVSWAALDKKKTFGFISKNILDRASLKPVVESNISISQIVNYDIGQNTVLYVICPKNRKNLCKLSIKHHNKWVRDNKGKVITLDAIAKSRSEFHKNKNLSTRIGSLRDTPQGVYIMWATMLSDDRMFGLLPRIDLDSSGSHYPPIPVFGFYQYSLFSSIIEQIMPSEVQMQYWFNELPLAYALGRSAIRIHTNTLDTKDEDGKNKEYFKSSKGQKFYYTAGCINLGNNMPKFLKIMNDLKVFDEDYKKNNKISPSTGKELSWNVINNLGRVFIVVIDNINYN